MHLSISAPMGDVHRESSASLDAEKWGELGGGRMCVHSKPSLSGDQGVAMGTVDRAAWTPLPLPRELGTCRRALSSPKGKKRASLVVQWLRIHLVMQRTWVPFLVWEDPTAEQISQCPVTTEPVLWSLRAKTTESTCHNY